ncbi:MAG: hypothetical protein ACRDD2_03555 [Sarcina sp.]
MKEKKECFCLNDDNALENIFEALENEKDNIVNVVMEPYKSIYIINELIIKYPEKKILYVTNEEFHEKEVNNIEIKYFHQLLTVESNEIYYDLIILDDLSAYSNYSKGEFITFVDYLYKKTNKILIFAIEEIFKNCSTIAITTQCKVSNFIEPRVIISRLNLKKKIPDIIMEYFEYFNRINDNAIIYVDKKDKETFYDNFNKYISLLEDIKIYKDVNNYEIIKLISQQGNKIIITDEVEKIIDKMENTNVIIYGSSKEFFTYKKIIFICGRLSLLDTMKEMIIVSKEDSYAIETSKKLARNFNKIVWEGK